MLHYQDFFLVYLRLANLTCVHISVNLDSSFGLVSEINLLVSTTKYICNQWNGFKCLLSSLVLSTKKTEI